MRKSDIARSDPIRSPYILLEEKNEKYNFSLEK